MMRLSKDQHRIYGSILIILSMGVAFGGIALDASKAHRSKWGSHAGYDIYIAPDYHLPANTHRSDGKWYYVEGYWDKPKATVKGVENFAEKLKAEAEEPNKPDVTEEEVEETNEKIGSEEVDTGTITQDDKDDGKSAYQTCKVHFTVYKRVITWESETHRTREDVGLKGAKVYIYQQGSNSVYSKKTTDDEGVAVFTVPLGKYNYYITYEDYEKENSNVQSWDDEGDIYYKKAKLLEEVIKDNIIDDTTKTVEQEDEIESGDLPIDTEEDPEDKKTVVTDEDDQEKQTDWKSPSEGGGQEQLEGSFDEYFSTTVNFTLIALGIIGFTGMLMLFFSGTRIGR